MQITGPLTIGVLESDMGGRELHIDFTDEFKLMSLQQTREVFRLFITEISDGIAQHDEQDADYSSNLRTAAATY